MDPFPNQKFQLNKEYPYLVAQLGAQEQESQLDAGIH